MSKTTLAGFAIRLMIVAGLGGSLAIGCATAPDSVEKKQALEADANATLKTMFAHDPSLRQVVHGARGYAVFPKVGKGGAVVGGVYGRGVVFEHGQAVGFAELKQASLGLQLGGQTFAELIVFPDEATLRQMQAGDFDLGANVSAVVIRRGRAASEDLQRGPKVFVTPIGGLMAELSISGQKIDYEPRG